MTDPRMLRSAAPVFRWAAVALVALLVSACSSGGGGAPAPTTGSVIVQADVSRLVDSGLDAGAIEGRIACPGGTSIGMPLAGATASGECIDLAPGEATFTVRFTYNDNGSEVELATASKSFTIVAGETRTLQFTDADLVLSDSNSDGVSNLDDLLLALQSTDNAFLSGLSLACVDVTPASSCNTLALIPAAGQPAPPPGFLAAAAVAGLTNYTSVQDALVEAITVTPTAVSDGATITVNGQAVVSGAPSLDVPFGVDGTGIVIVVTAADGVTQVTYHLSVTSQAQIDADLLALSLSAGALLSPGFDRDTTGYEATVAFETGNVTVTAETVQPAAILEIEGEAAASGVASNPLALGVGPNPIDIVVTAPDGLTQKQYTVTVTRLGSAELSALTIAGTTDDEPQQQVGLALDPAFQPGTTVYVSDAENRVVEAIVTATARAEGAIVEINGVIAGQDGTSQPIPLEVGPNDIEIVVTHPVSGSANPLTLAYSVSVVRQDPPLFEAEAYLKPSVTGAQFRYGTSVALSADSDPVHGYTAAVGAPEEAGGVGAVYVYTRNGSGEWSQQARLVPVDSAGRYNFGRSVALSESGNTLVVGAPGWDFVREFGDDDNPISGAVHVFTRAGNGDWVAQGPFAAFNASELDGFGYSVALSGSTLAVGAPGESSGQGGVFAPGGTHDDGAATESGAVYVYTLNGGPGLQAFIKSPLPVDSQDAPDLISERFGWSVALSAEAGQLTLGVGMPGDSGGAPPAGHGAVHVYTRDDSNWSPSSEYIRGPATSVNSGFGWTLALSAEGDTLAVGVPAHRGRTEGVWNGADGPDALVNGQTSQGPLRENSGAVHVYIRTGGPWTEQTFIKASNSFESFNFGFSLALSGDGDTLVVGAPGERSAATTVDGNQLSTGALSSGAAYAFLRDGERWEQVSYIKVPNSRTGILFGSSIAMTATGDLAAGGAPAENSATAEIVMLPPYPVDTGATDRGAAYIFRQE